ncbi:hypothetical protein E2C01_027588 [Portunus trituberculatus]|uniref:Uncharacterized protein n=1 Tax=Portunus trituberculatus TaxID=210409 RepID=A0A5B7ELQ0_PORTR|nr:hypothetical protein [Portunus trituberculatus]
MLITSVSLYTPPQCHSTSTRIMSLRSSTGHAVEMIRVQMNKEDAMPGVLHVYKKAKQGCIPRRTTLHLSKIQYKGVMTSLWRYWSTQPQEVVRLPTGISEGRWSHNSGSS